MVSTHLKNVRQLRKGKSSPGKNHTLLQVAPRYGYIYILYMHILGVYFAPRMPLLKASEKLSVVSFWMPYAVYNGKPHDNPRVWANQVLPYAPTCRAAYPGERG